MTRLLAAAWSADDIEQWLLEQVDAFLATQPAGEGLVTFDQSVVEKSESTCAQAAAVPLYRLRAALVTLLAAAHPIPLAQRYAT